MYWLPAVEAIRMHYDEAASIGGAWREYIIVHGMFSWITVIEKHSFGPSCGSILVQGTPVLTAVPDNELIILIANLLEVI